MIMKVQHCLLRAAAYCMGTGIAGTIEPPKDRRGIFLDDIEIIIDFIVKIHAAFLRMSFRYADSILSEFCVIPLMKSYMAWSETSAAWAQFATDMPASSRPCFILRRDAGFFFPADLDFSSSILGL